MFIEKFGVERWMDLYETRCTYNLAETCVDSLTLDELLNLCGRKGFPEELGQLRLSYGDIPGSLRLRKAIGDLYQSIEPDHVLVTHGAIGANSLIYETLIDNGDHVVAVFPTYQQHQSIPKCFGAQVDLLDLTPENNYLPDLKQVRGLVGPKTKLLALNNPNNPAGSLMDQALLEKIVEIARPYQTYILCDEVYRGLNDDGDGFTSSIADLYELGISTGSMSKVYSLAGLRLGWMASRAPRLLESVMTHRDYNTISVGRLDDHLASLALESKNAILTRSHAITRGNRRVLAQWVDNEPLISWSPPLSGTTALLELHLAISSWDFCVRLVEQTGVMLCPGSVLGREGFLRIGYGCSPESLTKGLEQLTFFLRQLATQGLTEGAA
ncbi:MAG: aminotransferase [Deltaproteobacteria bacterium]|jgi:aspartate/methionine/tyrosine aminotransferase|nr:aminotransferase [Deltaproteobacteria bacterium]